MPPVSALTTTLLATGQLAFLLPLMARLVTGRWLGRVVRVELQLFFEFARALVQRSHDSAHTRWGLLPVCLGDPKVWWGAVRVAHATEL